jgi:hypothetical protein
MKANKTSLLELFLSTKKSLEILLRDNSMKCGLIKFILYFCMCSREFLVLEAATTTTNMPTPEKMNTTCLSTHLLGFRIRSVRRASFSTIAQVHAENLFRIVEHRSRKRSQASCTSICDCRCDFNGRCTFAVFLTI